MFKGMRQQDSHELLRYLLGACQAEQEDYDRKERRAEAMKIVKTWTKQEVLIWANQLKLSDHTGIHAVIDDENEPLDGKQLAWLCENFTEKATDKLKKRLSLADKDKRPFCRGIEQLRAGIFPASLCPSDKPVSSPSSSSHLSSSLSLPHPSSSTSFVTRLFGGTLQSHIQCHECGHVSEDTGKHAKRCSLRCVIFS